MKATYETPRLNVYGSVASLTMVGKFGSDVDGNSESSGNNSNSDVDGGGSNGGKPS